MGLRHAADTAPQTAEAGSRDSRTENNTDNFCNYSGYAPERVARPSIPKGHAVMAESPLLAVQTGVWRPPLSEGKIGQMVTDIHL